MKTRMWMMAGMLVAVGCVLAVGTVGESANFPEKPITLIVHAGAGGGSDIFARTLSAAFDKEKILPVPIVVENKPGGSGAISFAYVGSKKGDPHFLLTAVTSFLTTPILRKSQITPKDFTPIANFAFDEYVVIVKAGGKYKTMKDVVDAAKANPKKLTVGGTQLGSSDSVCAYLIEKAAGVQFNFIVFNSGGEVNAALMGGHIDLAVSNPGEALELAKANRVLTLGVFAEKRLPGAPNVPTLKEQWIDAIYVQNRGLVAPGGIPEEARKVLEEAMLKYTKTKIFKDYIAEGMLSEAWMDGPTFGKWNDQEYGRYQVMFKDMGLLK
jgi:putative tricarboxylic transport membrane protein